MVYIIKTDLLFHSSGFGGNNLDRVQHCGEGRSIGTRLDCRTAGLPEKKWFKDLSVYREGEKIDLSELKT